LTASCPPKLGNAPAGAYMPAGRLGWRGRESERGKCGCGALLRWSGRRRGPGGSAGARRHGRVGGRGIEKCFSGCVAA
jgi:hypothetical protein